MPISPLTHPTPARAPPLSARGELELCCTIWAGVMRVQEQQRRNDERARRWASASGVQRGLDLLLLFARLLWPCLKLLRVG
eukprot:gene11755-64854_t